MSNKYGQNWGDSLASGGTPGSANSIRTNDIAPMIVEAIHFPVVPSSTNTVSVTAAVLDELATGLSVTLFYRVDANPQTNPFLAVPMSDAGTNGDGLAGDGVYGATLPLRPNNTIIEYYIQATDSTGHVRTWPAPARQDNSALPEAQGNFAQTINALYQVIDNFNYAGGQPFYQIIVTAAEASELDAIGRNIGGAADSDAAMNGSFVSIDGTGTELRQQMTFRNRGHGSRTARPNNIRVNFPNDSRWKGVRSMNLNTRYVHSQVTGAALFQKSGLPTANSRPVQVRINGAVPGGGAPLYGSYAHNEELSSEFAQNHWPDDSGGNVYRGIRIDNPSVHADLTYLGPDVNSCLSPPNCYTNLYFKQNNNSEYDFSDLIELTRVLSDPNISGEEYETEVRRVLNLEETMLYFAANTLVDNSETSLSNGNGDDYAMYRGGIDTRFLILPYDSDTIMGQGDTPGSITASLFRMNTGTTIPRLMNDPAFVPIYYAQLKKLIDTTFSAAQLNPLLDRVLGGFVPAGTITAMKNWQASRNAYVLSQIPLTYSASSTLGVSGGYFYTTFAVAPANGFANAIDTRTVLVNGLPAAYNAVAGSWSISGVPLLPGVNRLQVRFLGTNGIELAQRTVDVWYDARTPLGLSGTLTTNTFLTAANGPYNISGALTVPNNIALNIEAGTTVYVAPAATITVNGTGRILAPGTETSHIRIGHQPGVAGNWGSLDFIGASTESRLSYVDFDGCGGTSIGGHNAEVHVNNSVVYFDHLTFQNTPAIEYISFDNSSFIVQNSTFPTYPQATSAPEMLHGVNGIPAGGYGIFRDNYFGHTWGFNDTIDFTGGNRPGAILQVIGNVFDGAGDDHLDLDSTDAWIEGNIFMHAHRDPTRNTQPGGSDDYRDTASAISGGVDFAGQYSEWTIINNLFYDVDHAVLNKQGGRFVFANNTLVHVAKEGGSGLQPDIAAFDFTDDGLALPDPSIGAGAYVANNIIWDSPQLFANYNPANHNVILENNILPVPWSGPGSNNVVVNPLLNLSIITNISTADWKMVKQALTPQPGSAALGTGIGGFDIGGLNPKGLLVFGEPSTPTASTSATLNLFPGRTFNWGTAVPPYAWGYTAYKWKLDNGAWSAETSISGNPTINLTGLLNGPHTVYVVGKNDAGFYQDDPFVYGPAGNIPAHVSASRTWTVNTAFSKLVLNEVLARNVAAVANGEDYPDVVELYNPGGSVIQLGGMGLTDDPAQKFRYTFPSGTSIGPGQYLIVYGGNGVGAPGLHFGFTLNVSGSSLSLFSANGGLLDSVAFGLQVPDLSIGRLANGSWSLTKPSFGGPNLPQALGDSSSLKLNEWLTLGQSLYQDDFIELFNPDPLPVELSGMYLTDAPEGTPDLSRINSLSFIPGNGYTVFIADGNTNRGSDHVSFKLSPDQGQIALFSSGRSLIDCILYGPQSVDISEGRQPSGGPAFGFFNPPTPGGPNAGSSITVSNIIVNIVGLTNMWRYNAAGAPGLGTSWRATAYNDTIAGWTNGRAVFYHSTQGATLPFPINTDLPFTSPIQTTFYFRGGFNYTPNSQGTNFMISHLIDDGVVIYLNGQEAYRYNMPGGNPAYGTFASSSISTAGMLGPFPFPTTNLVAGTNVLAMELHQQSSTSSDIAMGIIIEDIRSITNILSTPIVLNEIMANNRSQTNANGSITDWVELFNPAPVGVDLSDMSLSDSASKPRRWVIPSGTQLSSGGYLVILLDGTNAPSTNAGPILNAGFAIKWDGDQIYLFDSLARGGSLVDSISFGLQVTDFTIARVPNGRGSWFLALPTPASLNLQATLADTRTLKVNEWMASPSSGDDWFELYNPNHDPISLGGLFLTDDINNRTQFRIPNLSFIGGSDDGFLRFEADNPSTFKGANHVNFKLAGSGEQIALFTPAQLLIDRVVFGPQATDVSQGRFPDGSSNVVSFPGTDSPGASNIRPLSNVVINEVLSHSEDPFEDAIELHNTSQTSVDISGWFITDRKSDPFRFRIPDGTILQAGGYIVFYEYQFNRFPGVAPSFALSSSHGEDLYLFTADAGGNLTGFRTDTKFDAAPQGVSIGTYQTSVGVDFTALSSRTFGADSPATLSQFRLGAGLPNAYPKVGPVVINEIHYHPPDVILTGVTNDNSLDEFIELYNFSGTTVQLFDPNYPTNHWKLGKAVDFDFPSGTSLGPGGYLLVVTFDPSTNASQLAVFRSTFGIPNGIPILGPYDGKLDNGGESVELLQPDAPLPLGTPDAGTVPYFVVDKVKYGDSGPWPSGADGTGNSLQRRNALAYGNDPVNWFAAAPTPGSASGATTGAPAITSLTPSQYVALGASITLSVSATGSGLHYQWNFGGSTIASATNSSLSLTNVQSGQAGLYQITISNPTGAVSGSILLDVKQPPLIVQQPSSKISAAGSSTYFGVAVQGSVPLTYQWYKNNISLPGQNGPSILLTNLAAANEGTYLVVITNAYGSVTSSPASLTLNAAPFITQNPQGTNVFVGADVFFSVSAVGSQPLLYQWRVGNTSIPNATSPTLTLNNVQLSDAGNYSVRVQNGVGSVTSLVAVLNVAVPPFVTITATDPVASEPGANTGSFTIARTGGTTQPLTVNLSVGGSATPSLDYTSLPSTVTIPAGFISTNLLVVALDDSALEPSETIIVSIMPGTTYAIGSPASATVTILDDDNLAPSVAITNPAPGTVIALPANLNITATASDSDGTVSKVEFYYQTTNKIGEALVAPFGITWTNAVAGTQSLTAVAYDNFGATGVSAPVSIILNAPPTLGFTSPSNGAAFIAPANVTLVVSASDADGVSQVQFLSGATVLATRSVPPYSFTASNLAAGSYTFSAMATDQRGATAFAAPISINVAVPAPSFVDAFLSRGVLFGYSNSITGNNTAYTIEAGEPKHDGKNGTHSGWVSWLAPVSGPVTMDTFGSGFDTVMAVYTGNVLSNLVVVASNDDASDTTLQSQLTFNAVAGTVYQIAVDGYSSQAYGTIVFNLNQANPNPVISAQPQSQIVNQGSTISFNVGVSGPGPFSYRWFFNSGPLPNATNLSLTITNARTLNEGAYYVVITNASGSVTSLTASLTVRIPPSIVQGLQPLVVDPGSNATFYITVSGSGPLSYQWLLNSIVLAGATGTNFTLSNVQHTNGGVYSVTVNNAAGSTSSSSELIVRPTLASIVHSNTSWVINLRGTPGKTYALETSSTLTNWSSLGAVTNSAVPAEFTIPGAGSPGLRGYRLKVLP
ncbi:MAG TPA: lamin tail domain-containing protein [Candidatus Saccharimonadales bacterium]|nr:lamin tail domain-containing protein [Candidatus Saccharimonadales bacterium]